MTDTYERDGYPWMVHRSDESFAYKTSVTDPRGGTVSMGIHLIRRGDVLAMEVDGSWP